MKVKKAKELNLKPDQDKFINDIVGKNKKSQTFSHLEHSYSGYNKPVVEYNAEKKGGILGKEELYRNKSHWNSPISAEPQESPSNIIENDSYVGVNENPKSPYKMK